MYSHFQESRASLYAVTVTWEAKRHSSECLPFLLLSSSFYCWVWCHMVWNTPLVSWGQLSQLCPLPAVCGPPAYSLAGQHKQAFMMCKHSLAISTSVCYQHCFGHIAPYKLLQGTLNHPSQDQYIEEW